MQFLEIYNILKQDNLDKICFVETGSFFLAIGSDAEYLSSVLELAKTCFGNNMCKVGFPNNSLSKYMEIFEKNNIPYVVYGYMLEDTYVLKVEIECKDKKYVKLVENKSNTNMEINNKLYESSLLNNLEKQKNKKEIYTLYKAYINKTIDCSLCPYRKIKVIKEISTCEKRISKLKLELQIILARNNNNTLNNKSLNTKTLTLNSDNLNTGIFDMLDSKGNGNV